MGTVGLEPRRTDMEAFLLILQEQRSIQAFNQLWKGQGRWVQALRLQVNTQLLWVSFQSKAATFSLRLDSLLRAEEQKGHGDIHLGHCDVPLRTGLLKYFWRMNSRYFLSMVDSRFIRY